MQQRLINRVNIVVGYIYWLQIIDLWPALFQMPADLVNRILNRSVLRTVWWTTNNMVPPFPHSLIHLRRLMRCEIVVYESPAKSRIGNSIIRVKHVLNKCTISHRSCARLSSNPLPNSGPCQWPNLASRDCGLQSPGPKWLLIWRSPCHDCRAYGFSFPGERIHISYWPNSDEAQTHPRQSKACNPPPNSGPCQQPDLASRDCGISSLHGKNYC